MADFTNLDEDYTNFLLEVWMLKTIIPKSGPSPILVIEGDQGTGKSSLMTSIKSILDPSSAGVFSMPTKETDLIAIVANTNLCAFDNCSGIPESLSDTFARMCTGGNYATRLYFTNTALSVVEIQRPTMLNGIGNQATKQDVIDRLLILKTKTISGEIKEEYQIKEKLKKELPFLLYDFYKKASWISSQLRITKHKPISRFPEFEKVGILLEQYRNLPRGTFLESFKKNIESKSYEVFHDDEVCVAILHALEKHGSINNEGMFSLEGTPSNILDLVNKDRKNKLNYNSSSFVKQLKFRKPILNKQNVQFEIGKKRRERFLKIFKDPMDSL